jgi:hypothetical protein
MPTIALRDQVVSQTPLEERPLVAKPRAASKDQSPRALIPFGLNSGVVT